jgi:hypothetical protein
MIYIYDHKNGLKEKTKYYAPNISVKCGQYKDTDMYQFTLNTDYGLNTDKDFKTPEAAFVYADKKILEVFTNVINNIKEQDGKDKNKTRSNLRNTNMQKPKRTKANDNRVQKSSQAER